jgi:hypothetical protein
MTNEKELTKEDKKYLRFLLEESHKRNNSTSINECKEDCWYKEIIKKLNLITKRK